MNGSIYTVVCVLGLVLVVEQILQSVYTLDKISDFIVDIYTKERKIRLYGEVLALRSNIVDAYNYIEKDSQHSKEDSINENIDENITKDIRKILDDTIERRDKNSFLLRSYLDNIDSFLNKYSSFKSLSIDDSHNYRVIEHKQKNLNLDSSYPNWYFRFVKEN